MLVDINKLSPNPYRDFDLYPIGDDQVAKLIESYERDGDWGVLPVRPHPDKSDGFQIANGHHRLEAMRRLGFKMADVKIDSFDDDKMLSLMISENATQRGQNAAATLDSVAAAMKRIAYLALTDSECSAEFRRAFFVNEYSVRAVRGSLESGRGLGRDIVHKYIGKKIVTGNEIEMALATIKASDIHVKIARSVHDQIKAEALCNGNATDAEECEVVAARVVKVTNDRATEKSVLFDARIATLFKNDYQLELFRKAVTSGTLAKVLPQDRQYDLANACLDWHKRNDIRLTELSITKWLNTELDKFLKTERRITKRERDLAMKDSADRRIMKSYEIIRDALSNISGACGVLKEEYERYPANGKPPVNATLQDRLPNAIRDLSRLHERLSKMT